MSASKHRIYHRLQLAAHRLQKSADAALLPVAQVTTAQAAVLAVIQSQGPVTQSAIARQLGLNESAMTAMVGRLQRMGLVARAQARDDARAWHVVLTPQGRQAVERLGKAFRAINRRLEQVLDEQELARLADYLGRIGQEFAG
ncbi:MAG: MarR family transcriptional regulator [Hyphomicrobiaceae bacterium]|nr:MarR family transcriptional regulator [Hyphomicrobiaceae bacterium]